VLYDPKVHRWDTLTVPALVEVLAAVTVPWWLSGGWALDEFLGRTTRAHADIDVTVARQDWSAMYEQLRPVFDVFEADDGQLRPVNGALDSAKVSNMWARDLGGGPFRVQFNLEPIAGGTWTYARDPRVQRPLEDAAWWSGRAWCISPAYQLLWKAKAPAAKDEHDNSRVVPRLSGDDRAWLRQAVLTAHPASPWASRLAPTP
jgi:hypothetical protein